MTTRIVTGTILQPNGTAYTDPTNFRLEEEIISSSVVVPEYVVNITTDAQGEFSVELFVPDTGTCLYTVTFPDGSFHGINLGSGTSIDLSTLISAAESASTPSALQVIIDAHTGSYLHSEYNVKSYGAKGDGVTDDTAAIQAAIDATVSGFNGGLVYVPRGIYIISSPITLKSGVCLMGSNRWSTYIKNIGTSYTVFFDNTERASLKNLSVLLVSTETTQKGIVIIGNLVSPGSHNFVSDVSVYSAGGIGSGHVGLSLQEPVTAGTLTVSNHFNNIWFEYIDKPIIIGENTEGNIFSDITIDAFGSGDNGIGCLINGHTNQMTNIRFASQNNATSMRGWDINGSGNYLRGVADIGAGYLYIDNNNLNNSVDGLVIGTTTKTPL